MSRTQTHQTRTGSPPLVDTNTVCGAVVTGDLTVVQKVVAEGGCVNERSRDGFVPLCIAAFWGHADIVEFLLENGADINVQIKDTEMTACHCAAFQGHGKVLMHLTRYSPDLSVKDSMGRTAVDFASANELIWPFFAAKGYKQTSKETLIKMNIIKKTATPHKTPVTAGTAEVPKQSWFSRPGSSYVLAMQSLTAPGTTHTKVTPAVAYGDVLYEAHNEA